MLEDQTISASDIEAVARLHAASLTDSLVTALGMPVLLAYYRFIRASGDEVLFVLKDNGQVLGACVLSFASGSASKRFLKYAPVTFAAHAGLKFLTQPQSRKKILATLQSRDESPPEVESLPEVVQIFADSTVRNKKVGTRLLEKVEAYLGSRSCHRYFVKTALSPDNEAIHFYTRRNFARIGEGTSSGKRYVYFSKEITGAQPSRAGGTSG